MTRSSSRPTGVASTGGARRRVARRCYGRAVSTLTRIVSSILGALSSGSRTTARRPTASTPRGREVAGGRRSAAPATDELGRSGADATVEVDARRIGRVRMSYNPVVDGDPDPGEIVWTWVPYEENDGRGKDRPVLIVASTADGRQLLAVQLTSKDHDGDRDYVAIGAGGWDGEGRASWAKLDRVFLVRPGGMRREAAALDRARYDLVATALSARYGWS